MIVVPQYHLLDGINATRSRPIAQKIDRGKCAHGPDCLQNYRRDWKAKTRKAVPETGPITGRMPGGVSRSSSTRMRRPAETASDICRRSPHCHIGASQAYDRDSKTPCRKPSNQIKRKYFDRSSGVGQVRSVAGHNTWADFHGANLNVRESSARALSDQDSGLDKARCSSICGDGTRSHRPHFKSCPVDRD